MLIIKPTEDTRFCVIRSSRFRWSCFPMVTQKSSNTVTTVWYQPTAPAKLTLLSIMHWMSGMHKASAMLPKPALWHTRVISLVMARLVSIVRAKSVYLFADPDK
jgi:hypothetical protein